MSASEDTPRRRGTYATGRARREKIILTASEQFAERGFRGATILEIAAACKISRAGLLHHFPDKEALLAAVLQHRDAEDRDRFRPYVREPHGLGILAGIVDLAAHNEQVRGLIELFVRVSAEASAPDHPAHEYFAQRYARITKGTAASLRAAQRAGYVRRQLDPEDTSIRLTALMDGLQANWLLDRRLDMAGHMRRAVLDLLTASGRREFERVRLPVRDAHPAASAAAGQDLAQSSAQERPNP